MSDAGRDVPHYCRRAADQHARPVPPDALALSDLTVRHAGTVEVLGRAPGDAVRAGCVGAMLQHGGLPGEARVGEVLHLLRCSYADPWPLDDLVATTGIGGLLGRDVDP